MSRWVDTAADRFPKDPNETVQILYSDQPQKFVKHASQDAHHLVLTYSHALDLDLCNALLSFRFSSVGLIGSKTKWARFEKRLKSLGHHARSLINLITCPIGRPECGKHPHQIAIGVASEFLMSDVAFERNQQRSQYSWQSIKEALVSNPEMLTKQIKINGSFDDIAFRDWIVHRSAVLGLDISSLIHGQSSITFSASGHSVLIDAMGNCPQPRTVRGNS